MEIELPDYRKIASEVKKRKVLVEEREVEAALKWLQKSRAKFSALNRPCQEGDFVEIEFEHTPLIREKESFSKKEAVQSFKSRYLKDAFVLGQGGLIPGFEKKIGGMSSGQEKEFFISLPKNKGGGEVNFKVKMKSVQKMELPEICDEWAKNLGNFKNLEELKKNIKEGLIKEKEMQESQRVQQEILAQITQKSKLETPELLVEGKTEQMIKNLKQNVSNVLKISFKEYLEKLKKSEKEIKDSFKPEAEKRVKTDLVLQEISKQENIEVSEQEVQERANRFLEFLRTPEQAKKRLDSEKLKSYAKELLRNEKTLSFLEDLTNKP